MKGITFTKCKYKIPAAASSKNKTNTILEKYGEHCITWVGYADNIVLVFDDEQNLKKPLKQMNNTFKRCQPNINTQKTDTMILNFNGTEDDYPETICKLNGYKIKNVIKSLNTLVLTYSTQRLTSV